MAPLRAAVAAGDHRRADELARALQSDRWVQAYQPLGWIEWEHDRTHSGKVSAAYQRSLDMSAAVAVTDAGTGVRLETFVSAVDDVLVARADGAPTAAPLLCSPHPVRTTSSTQCGVTWVTMSGRAPGEGMDSIEGYTLVGLPERASSAVSVGPRAVPRWRPGPGNCQLPGAASGEWADDLEPQELGHRHLSHLYGVFPGSRWAAAEPDEEVEASRAALSLRLAEGSGYTGWSQAWVLCLAARLRDGVLAERAIETLLGPLSSRSLLDLHPLEGWPGGAVFQIDGNLGAVAGIAELLVQSHHEVVTILPALPAGWPSGKRTRTARPGR